ncbi:uncharacterized protein BX664DRAFT_340270 [Halteromyces radiatus]|uniref:uncharacterized protein n=1 Tax=Halteromyces radiatus TaxID=101107 RepID=UPI00221F1FBA|nr:uncharacterized protein BX664DRAFT_340270 [Halteromyces radiatus]KAI8081383.1 hypothetical protein BX664DRAFT_340270 [Halteromyces radiatus]
MFLEYVDGGQLLDYIIRHGKLKEKQARKFSRQIVSALDYCHRNAIVHRDLKIENILITRNEEIKIIDFGLSNFYSSKSLLNTFCGSLYFAAPELLRARDYTGPEVDVWSFGVVLFVLVCGRVPFDDTSLPILHQKIKAGIVDYPDHLSKDCVDLLSNILQVDPMKRETLNYIENHPWMNKGYNTPINNHLQQRSPLTTIDDDAIQMMYEYGFGDIPDIRNRLQAIITSQEYQSAIHPTVISTPTYDHHHGSRLRWRRSRHDSSDGRPALYNTTTLNEIQDPLLSIYYLVKERKALDEIQSPDKTSLTSSSTFDTSAPSSPIPNTVLLTRSGSTTTPSNRTGWHTSLSRSKTDRSHTKKSTTTTTFDSDYAATIITNTSTANWGSRSLGRSNSLLQRSKSAAKRLGSILQSHNNLANAPLVDQQISSINSKQSTVSRSQSMRQQIRRIPSFGSSLRRSNNLRHDDSHTAFEDEIVTALLTTMNNNNKNNCNDTQYQDQPKISAYPKSLFRFNRRHLFRVPPHHLMHYLMHLLMILNIQGQAVLEEPYTIQCSCRYSHWKRWMDGNRYDVATISDDDDEHDPQERLDDKMILNTINNNDNDQGYWLRFTILIYQARWAGGRLGIKLTEAEEEIGGDSGYIYRSLYFMILRCLGSFIDQYVEPK